MGRLAKVWKRGKADSDAKSAVCVDLQTQVTKAQESALDPDDAKALDEMEAAFPEIAAAAGENG